MKVCFGSLADATIGLLLADCGPIVASAIDPKRTAEQWPIVVAH